MSLYSPIQHRSQSPQVGRSQLRCDLPPDLPVLTDEIELLSAWLGEVLADISIERPTTSGSEYE